MSAQRSGADNWKYVVTHDAVDVTVLLWQLGVLRKVPATATYSDSPVSPRLNAPDAAAMATVAWRRRRHAVIAWLKPCSAERRAWCV